jgi:hypothetical protein
MATKTLNDYTCFDNDKENMLENDSLQQILQGEEEKNAPQQKRNVRKAIERYIERIRLKNALSDEFKLNA